MYETFVIQYYFFSLSLSLHREIWMKRKNMLLSIRFIWVCTNDFAPNRFLLFAAPIAIPLLPWNRTEILAENISWQLKQFGTEKRNDFFRFCCSAVHLVREIKIKFFIVESAANRQWTKRKNCDTKTTRQKFNHYLHLCSLYGPTVNAIETGKKKFWNWTSQR